jgi:hypothetical protein
MKTDLFIIIVPWGRILALSDYKYKECIASLLT